MCIYIYIFAKQVIFLKQKNTYIITEKIHNIQLLIDCQITFSHSTASYISHNNRGMRPATEIRMSTKHCANKNNNQVGVSINGGTPTWLVFTRGIMKIPSKKRMI